MARRSSRPRTRRQSSAPSSRRAYATTTSGTPTTSPGRSNRWTAGGESSTTSGFTRWPRATLPGLPASSSSSPTTTRGGSTAADVEERLTAVVETAIGRARAGSTTLCTASGLSGTHLAYLLGHVSERVDGPAIDLVGHAAKLYDRLGYDVPNVTATGTFDAPSEVLSAGRVTIAGPEVPVEGSSGRLFGTIRSDAGATLLQVTGGGTDPVTDAGCTVYDYTVSNHPADETVDTVVEALDPVEVVITHQPGRASNRFKDRYDSALVWATDSDDAYVIYDGGWQAPPWVGERTERAVLGDHFGPRFEMEVPPPVPERHGVDLAAEGLPIEELTRRLAPPAGDVDRRADPAGNDPGAGDGPTGGSNSAAQRDDETPPADGPSLDAVVARLDEIGAAVTTPRVRVRVIRSDEGLTLLRVLDGDVALEDGAELEVVPVDGGETDDD
ncbi:hypothetical protein BRC75_07600 [Halobacteriales archaeon QH_7_69_31]|nr:MAG: hypothetical protein BRC75_07600 [Halobacteriales archaeon QH_7_69_31]